MSGQPDESAPYRFGGRALVAHFVSPNGAYFPCEQDSCAKGDDKGRVWITTRASRTDHLLPCKREDLVIVHYECDGSCGTEYIEKVSTRNLLDDPMTFEEALHQANEMQRGADGNAGWRNLELRLLRDSYKSSNRYQRNALILLAITVTVSIISVIINVTLWAINVRNIAP